MPLEANDRELLDRVLASEPDAWPAFVDRFLGLISHVVTHTADCRGVHLSAADREDLIADVFVALLDRDMNALRRFQRRSSLHTYLVVIARRVVVRRIMQRVGAPNADAIRLADLPSHESNSTEQRVADQEQVAAMLGGLPEDEARVIRMFHLEGRSYHEISRSIGVPENTIGPVLSRARSRLRRHTEPH